MEEIIVELCMVAKLQLHLAKEEGKREGEMDGGGRGERGGWEGGGKGEREGDTGRRRSTCYVNSVHYICSLYMINLVHVYAY